jgi:hypothetical protein
MYGLLLIWNHNNNNNEDVSSGAMEKTRYYWHVFIVIKRSIIDSHMHVFEAGVGTLLLRYYTFDICATANFTQRG